MSTPSNNTTPPAKMPAFPIAKNLVKIGHDNVSFFMSSIFPCRVWILLIIYKNYPRQTLRNWLTAIVTTDAATSTNKAGVYNANPEDEGYPWNKAWVLLHGPNGLFKGFAKRTLSGKKVITEFKANTLHLLQLCHAECKCNRNPSDTVQLHQAGGILD
jgi:hypothetical protein